MKATNINVIQVQEDLPNPVINLSGYQPTTGYWPLVIRMSNALIKASAVNGFTVEQIKKGGNRLLEEEIFKGDHTAVEWAEMVMAVNHILWFWHEVGEREGIEYLEPVTKALSDLYYQWHDKALKTLKGDDLSTYLTITD